MRYDPVKDILGNAVRGHPLLRKSFYGMLGLAFLREWHVKRELRRVHRLRGIGDLFDAGTGFGQYTYYCKRRFAPPSILAVDVKEDYIADLKDFVRALSWSDIQCAVEDLTDPRHRNAFDTIMSVDVMEHIEDDITVFQNFFQALRPGGTLIVNTPSTLGGSDAHSPDDESFIEEHARIGYDPEDLARKLEEVGFSIERRQFTYGAFGTVAWRFGIKWPMRLLGFSKIFLALLPVYYLVTFPITLPLMMLDYAILPSRGSGLLVTARKPAS